MLTGSVVAQRLGDPLGRRRGRPLVEGVGADHHLERQHHDPAVLGQSPGRLAVESVTTTIERLGMATG